MHSTDSLVRLNEQSNESLVPSQETYARFRAASVPDTSAQPGELDWQKKASESATRDYRVPTGSPAIWLEQGI